MAAQDVAGGGEAGDPAAEARRSPHHTWLPPMPADLERGGSVPPAAGGALRAPVTSKAESIVRVLAPDCAPTVYGRLRRERVETAMDLARLDKDDLRELGLSMVERSCVLGWARAAFPPRSNPETPDRSAEPGTPGFNIGTDLLARLSASRTMSTDSIDAPLLAEHQHSGGLVDEESHRRLEAIEQQAEFWCGIAGVAGTEGLAAKCRSVMNSPDGLRDVRENLLESLFDLSHERVKEVYYSMCRAAEDTDGRITAIQLAHGLHRCGLPDIDSSSLQKLLEAVVSGKEANLQLAEFEAILSRLTLAQLLTRPATASFPSPLAASSSGAQLAVVDYNVRSAAVKPIAEGDLKSFFFGHRPEIRSKHEASLVRWTHLRGLDLTLLLALTVKYSLHPLAVEDVLHQRASKTDRHGQHYFTTIERLCLSGPAKDSEPVCVNGHHVSIFSAGPPSLDTVVTVAQTDNSFSGEWPGGCPQCTPGGLHALDQVDDWAEKIRQRLTSPISRLRERRGDYLVYVIIDIIADDLLAVVKAYTGRLSYVEAQSKRQGASFRPDSLCELATARQQLAMVMRRVKGLNHVVRRMVEDPDLLSGQQLQGYLQDIGDHLDDAHDDCSQLQQKCHAIEENYELAVQRQHERLRERQGEAARRQELRRSMQADRQNSILFCLTIVTTIFAPVQFLAGVYGMNFQDASGKPTIPELLWGRGYLFFWAVIVGYLVVASLFATCLFCCMLRRTKDDTELDTGESSNEERAPLLLPSGI